MKKSLTRRFCLFIPILYLSLTIISCNTSKKIKYFQDIPDSGQLKNIPAVAYVSPIIHSGDIMNIAIQLIDQTSAGVINAGNLSSGGSTSAAPGGSGAAGILAALSGGSGAGQQQPVSGYLVNDEGYIDMPIIGKIKAAGLTSAQLRDTVYNYAVKYYIKPTVAVSFANFKVDITGEVLKPGQYIMPAEKETILDALAMAGDLTIFGKRENVLLIRENPDGSKTPYRVNLKKSNIMSEPYYYLRQNDVIYVEPRKAKSDATDAAQAKYISIIGTIFSIILVFATRRN